MLLVNWSWDLFIWDLRELLKLLTTTPSEFNYLFVTDFLRARAAYLAANGSFDCTQQVVLMGLGENSVQFVSIYYRLLVRTLLEVLKSEMGRRLIGEGEERLFQLAISEVERQYLEILQMIALAPDMDLEIHGYSLDSWISGQILRKGKWINATPADVHVSVFTKRYGRHRLVQAGIEDMVRKIQKREAFRTYLKREGEVRRNDLEAEKLSRFVKVPGYDVVKYGALEVQYYLTLINPSKSTLYAVCADRTMRIYQGNSLPLGTRPTRIAVFENGGADDDLYVVTFDSGAAGVYAIDFRPQKENEHVHVPDGVWRLPSSGGVMIRGRGEHSIAAPGSASGDHPPADVVAAGVEKSKGRESVAGDRSWPTAPTTKLLTAGGDGAPRVRVNVQVDAEGMAGSGGHEEVAELREHLDKRLDVVADEMGELREENEDLKAMQAEGLFNFVNKVDPDELRVFFAILKYGDQSKAARALGIKDSTFRDRIRRWRGMAPAYRAMYRLIAWRKAVGRKILVPFNETMVGPDAGSGGDRVALLRQILEGLRAMKGSNWDGVRDELEEAIREELGM